MIWVTSPGLKINRAATAWLIRRFIDPDAQFVFVSAGNVADEALRLGGIGFHAPRSRYPARNSQGRTPFEVLAIEHCATDEALQLMSALVRQADVPQPREMPEAAGLRLISSAFPLVTADDNEIIERSSLMYDALYAAVQQKVRAARATGNQETVI